MYFYKSLINILLVLICNALVINHSMALSSSEDKTNALENNIVNNCKSVNIANGASQEKPVVLFTDVVSGPSSGGEDNLGAYLSIFGFNLGQNDAPGKSTHVCINDIEVAAYRYMGDAVSQYALPNKTLQRITVQVGALGNSSRGVALPLKIIVNGQVSSEEHFFTIQPGDIYYVDNKIDDDAEGEVNDPARPFRYVQTPDKHQYGVMEHVKPGDFVVMRGGKTWTDTGIGHRFLRFRRITGTRPTGDPGDGPITVMGYPGEDVLIQCKDDSYCGIHGVDGYADEEYERDSDWITISNLRIRAGGPKVKDGPINLQHRSDNWRIVNNELFDWDANDQDDKIIDGKKYRDARSAGITGDGVHIKILGNYIHDINGGYRNHGIYIDGGAEDVEIAFNHMERLYGGNIIQTYDSVGFPDGKSKIKNIQIHHNLLHDTVRYGINIADNTESAIISNNVIYKTAYAGLRFSTGSALLIHASHNTLYDVCLNARDIKYAAINNDWNGDNISITNNIVVAHPTCPGYFYSSTRSGKLVVDNNLYYGLSASVPSRDEHGNKNRPDFVKEKDRNFALGKMSKAINAGRETLRPVITDFMMQDRDTKPDIGAYEFKKP